MCVRNGNDQKPMKRNTLSGRPLKHKPMSGLTEHGLQTYGERYVDEIV
jgi:hypothetical protein